MNKKLGIIGGIAVAGFVVADFGASYIVGKKFMENHDKYLTQLKENPLFDVKSEVSGSPIFGYKFQYDIDVKPAASMIKDGKVTITASSNHGFSYFMGNPLSMFRYQMDAKTTWLEPNEIPIHLTTKAALSPIASSSTQLSLAPLEFVEGEKFMKFPKGVKLDISLGDIMALRSGKDSQLKIGLDVGQINSSRDMFEKELDLQGVQFALQGNIAKLIEQGKKIQAGKFDLKENTDPFKTLELVSLAIKKAQISDRKVTLNGSDLAFLLDSKLAGGEWKLSTSLAGKDFKIEPKKGKAPFDMSAKELLVDISFTGLSEKTLAGLAEDPLTALQESKNITLAINDLQLKTEQFGQLGTQASIVVTDIPKDLASDPKQIGDKVKIDLAMNLPLGNEMISGAINFGPAKQMVEMLKKNGVLVKKGDVQYSAQLSLHPGKITSHGKDMSKDPILGSLVGLDMVIKRFTDFQGKSRMVEAKTNLYHIYTLQMAYQLDNDSYADDFKLLGYQSYTKARYRFGFTKDGGDFAKYCSDCTADAENFKVVAIGNIDDDEKPDVWTINQDKELKHVINDLNDLAH